MAAVLLEQLREEIPEAELIMEPNTRELQAFAAGDRPGVAKALVGNSKLGFGIAPSDIDPLLDSFDRVIYLERDPRDRLVSTYFHLAAIRVKSPWQRIRISKALKRKHAKPYDITFRHLFDLLEDFPSRVTRHVDQYAMIYKWLNKHKDQLEIITYEKWIAENSATQTIPHLSRVKRSSIPEQWSYWYTMSDVALIKPFMEPVLKDMGRPCGLWPQNTELDLAEESRAFLLKAWGYPFYLLK